MTTTSQTNALEAHGPMLASMMLIVAILFFVGAVGMGAWWIVLQRDTAAKRVELKKATEAASPQPTPAPADALENALQSYPLPSVESLRADLNSSAKKAGITIQEYTTDGVSARPVIADMMQTQLRLVHLKIAGDLPNILRWTHQSVENQPFRWITLFRVDASGDETVYRIEMLAAIK